MMNLKSLPLRVTVKGREVSCYFHYKDSIVFEAQLGETQCCGSAEVWGMYSSRTSIEAVFKGLWVAAVYFNPYGWEQNLIGPFDVPGGRIYETSPLSRLWLLEISDNQKYYDWISK